MTSALRKQLFIWGASFLLLAVLTACSSTESTPSTEEPEEATAQTISYTTQTGEQVKIPVNPQRVIYLGSAHSDLIAMNIPVVGTNMVNATGSDIGDRLDGVEDVGNPGDLEAITALQPDLILNGYTQDADRNTALSKIAPTIPFNSALPYTERVRELGKIFGKQDEAEQWITKFDAQSQAMWDKLQIPEGETATIFLQLGKQLYVMGNRSLGVVLYQEHGFAVPPAIQKNIIDENLTFIQPSEELLPEYAGDHLFVLSLDNDESHDEIDQMMESTLWKNLPAVKQGHVYTASSDWNTDGLLALEQLLNEIPKWMNR